MARADDEKLNALLKKQQGIQAKIAAVKAAQNAQARRDDTRLKVLVGAAVLSDAQRRPDVNRMSALFSTAQSQRIATATS